MIGLARIPARSAPSSAPGVQQERISDGNPVLFLPHIHGRKVKWPCRRRSSPQTTSFVHLENGSRPCPATHSDYVCHPEQLRSLDPHFDSPMVGGWSVATIFAYKLPTKSRLR